MDWTCPILKKRLTELLTDKNKTISKKAKSVLEKIEKYE